MTQINNSRHICGLGHFANQAAKAGYTNPNGTVNLMEAQSVVSKYGKLVPKSELDEQTLKELKEASDKFRERAMATMDSFQKVTK